MGDEDRRTVWCGNLSDKVTEELLYELFLQVAPLERVHIPTDKEGRRSNFAFVTMKHEVSVEYAVQMLNGTNLYEKWLNVKPRNANRNQMHQEQRQAAGPNFMENVEQLLRMGQCMQLSQASPSPPYHGHSHERYGRARDNFKPYKHHERHESSNYHGRNNQWSNHNRDNRNRRRFH